MSDISHNSTIPPFHKTELFLKLSAEQASAEAAAAGDPLETARVTVRFGRLIQFAYEDYQAARAVDTLMQDFKRRALEDGASYGN